MDREEQEKYRRIIEIIDSEDDSEEVKMVSKKTWDRNAGNKGNSEIKLKGSSYILKREKEVKVESNCSDRKVRGNRVQYEDVCTFKDIEVLFSLTQMTNNLN